MFRFSIRDLLWLHLVVALAVAWGISWFRTNSRLWERENECQRLGLALQQTRQVARANGLTIPPNPPLRPTSSEASPR